jgi:hypothetical protein
MAEPHGHSHVDPLSVPFLVAPSAAAAPGEFRAMEAGLEGLGVDPTAQGVRMRVMNEHAQGVLSDEERDRALEADPVALEIIIGKSNELQAWFLEVGAQRARAVCKVKASGTNFEGQQGSWSGTGFLVSPNILVTNHHVLNSPEVAAEATCLFNYQVNPEGLLLPTKEFRVKPARLFLTSPVKGGLDFTFVWVDGGPGDEFGFMPLDRSAFKTVVGEFANIIQHPRGDPKSVVIQENQVTWQDVTVIHYLTDTEPGSSGSCVFNNTWKAVALHHASRKAQDNEPEAKDAPYRNEGIKFSAIAAHLERLSEGGPDQAAAREVLGLFQGTDAMMGFFGSLGREAPPPEAAAPDVEAVVNRYRGEADDIDVGFWNVEWFSRTYREKLDAVARMVVSMNLDVWAFEESSADAAAALVNRLKTAFRADYDFAASEPDASPNKQTTTVLWNKKTVTGKKLKWPADIEPWFQVDSRDFDDLGLEAVEGRVFDRYPALYHFEANNRAGRDAFDFYLVPLHLKAMDEGSKRRRMAAKVLAVAIRKMIAEKRAGADWVIGGDFNAALATDDFADLIAGGMVPLSAADEASGAFSYIKRPKSLIDHIFLSANLARTYGEDDYFIVAADRELPGYVRELSDHRPVLVRLSLLDRAGQPRRARRKKADGRSPALEELRQALLGNGEKVAPAKAKRAAGPAKASARTKGK